MADELRPWLGSPDRLQTWFFVPTYVGIGVSAFRCFGVSAFSVLELV
jgi:hypothetical protein